ncbi:MAG: imidazole glycerol phosphate synthase subunit HisH [Opitutae bacterium]|nr:imidazole glycerol phosphate synthase subunit HisH [Opitutae bacterium]
MIDYGMGNLRSVKRALEVFGVKVKIVQEPEEVRESQAIIFPGQGAISGAMSQLRATGFDVFLKNWIFADKPFFGICLGMQLLFENSEEGNEEGLGVFRGAVKHFPKDVGLKIPHMGWNTISINKKNAGSFADNLSKDGKYFYFVHSYYVETSDESIVWSTSEYGLKFVSGVRRGNVFAVQFHPEKSQEKGLLIYKNFLNSVSNRV